MPTRRLLELFLSEVIIYTIVFLLDEYVGYLLSIILGCLSLALLIVTSLLEWVEPSRVPRWYFHLMWLSILAPAIVAGFFLGMYYWI